MSVHTENASQRIEKLTYHIDDHDKHDDEPGERDERRYLVLVGFFEYLIDYRGYQSDRRYLENYIYAHAHLQKQNAHAQTEQKPELDGERAVLFRLFLSRVAELAETRTVRGEFFQLRVAVRPSERRKESAYRFVHGRG